MKIIGLPILQTFKTRHADLRGPLEAWQTVIEKESWGSPQEVKECYRSVDILSGNRLIFNLKGNAYRLLVQVSYRNGIVVIEWVGTHAEYSKRIF